MNLSSVCHFSCFKRRPLAFPLLEMQDRHLENVFSDRILDLTVSSAGGIVKACYRTLRTTLGTH